VTYNTNIGLTFF